MTKTFKQWLIGILLGIYSLCAHPATPNNHDQEIETIIANHLDNTLPHPSVGIFIQSMDSGKIIAQYNAQQLMTPASILKLFTATAELSYLGKDFQFQTRILKTGKIIHHSLHGNLIIQFNGDPTLSTKAFTKLFDNALSQLRVRNITGRIIIDDRAYDQIAYPPGWIHDDITYAYAAPTSAIILDNNAFMLILTRDDRHHTVNITTKNAPPNLQIHSNIRFADKPDCPIAIYRTDQTHYEIKGCFPPNIKSIERFIAIPSMRTLIRDRVNTLLKQHHLIQHRSVTFTRTPRFATVISTHASQPLNTIVETMLKHSDNLIANTLIKTLGHHYFHTMGSWENGLMAMKFLLHQNAGIDFLHSSIEDGAGLSRYNLVTPKQFGQLLNYIYHDNTVKPSLLNALPIAGQDGTLRHRLTHLYRHTDIHAKTGSMTGVLSLAGYTINHGHAYAFVIIMNQLLNKPTQYLSLQKALCQWLIDHTQTGAHHG